ncbi:hypothetical protein [Mycobacteroides salmoniphilum]|uniref:hypothetical protein n=1 Tax=Mycobacteroides salmoniphilum TaxID=404941 RepID=UPI0010D67A5A|nr:hypothetical protein [Mycobacteroides salmoniphilum]TDZ94998.1 hypothetical protein CCUG62472_01815 [Mycobacteroides salmoniphilum]
MAGSGTPVEAVDTQLAGSGTRVEVDTQNPGAGIHMSAQRHSQGQEEGRRVAVPGVAETE